MLQKIPISSSRQAQDLVEVMTSCFTGVSGTDEYNFMLKPVANGSLNEQLDWLESAMDDIFSSNGLDRKSIVFRRFLCADLPGEIDALRRHHFSDQSSVTNGALSLVIQPPSAPALVTLWVYCVKDNDKSLTRVRDGATFTLQRGGLEHTWTTGLTCPEHSGTRDQTIAIFDKYNGFLEQHGLTLQDHCLRTWFYFADVDNHYGGFVEGRNQVFARCNLTPDTHYIASTGIQGSHPGNDSLVMMDAYTVKGVQPRQIKYLKALDHLSDTHVYGVAFERATQVSYRDRRHIIISGTASIDSSGAVVHDGDVSRQLDRTLENIAALLSRADATLDDMQHFIAYVRKPDDAQIVNDALAERLGDKPFLVVTGPVCRPDWLVEIEGIAITANNDDSVPAF